MNNCIFTTHATLTKLHAESSLRSLLTNQNEDMTWDWFIIYNTHPHEIDNDWLVDKIRELDVRSSIENLAVFPYELVNCPKTLTQDTINQFGLLVENGLCTPGKTLLLKSDYCLSSNFNTIFKTHTNTNSIWSLPIYNAKAKVSQLDIDKLCRLEKFDYIAPDTYFRGGTNSPLTPGTRQDTWQEASSNGELDTHPSIKFVGSNVQTDYNVHVFTNDIIPLCFDISKKALNPEITWGSTHGLFYTAFDYAGVDRSTEIGAFGVHMYHTIISENHKSERGDARKLIKGEEY